MVGVVRLIRIYFLLIDKIPQIFGFNLQNFLYLGEFKNMANYNVTVECTYTFDVEIMKASRKAEAIRLATIMHLFPHLSRWLRDSRYLCTRI